jgi:peptide/nickel transport system permease protein
MLKFIIKRIALMVPVLLGINFIIFAIMYLSPVNPALLVLGQGASEAALVQWNEENGLNEPFLVQYFNNVKNFATGKFGNSYMSGRPVIAELMERFFVTGKLAITGMLVAMLIGIPVGVLSSVMQYTFFDYAGSFLALIFAAIPSFWFALMLILVFALKIPLFPVSGLETASGYVLPTIAIGFLSSASILRMTRSTMLDTIRQDYIRTIRAKGAPESYVIFKHALKNALLPILTVCGMYFGTLLGGLVVVETVFALPGMGVLLVTSVRNQDRPIVIVAITLLAFAFSAVNLIVDLLYAFFDPRIKSTFQRVK